MTPEQEYEPLCDFESEPGEDGEIRDGFIFWEGYWYPLFGRRTKLRFAVTLFLALTAVCCTLFTILLLNRETKLSFVDNQTGIACADSGSPFTVVNDDENI